MQYRRLGKTGISTSVVGIGSWQFAGVWDKQFEQAEVDALLARAGEAGVNFIDTAECYGDHLAERFIGNALLGQRHDWIIATKFGHNQANELGDDNYRPEQVLLQLEASLRALRTDYIDIYQMHSADDALFHCDALWTMLDKQVQAGKVRFLGNSVARPNNVEQVAQSSHYGISVIQTLYNVVRQGAARHLFPLAQEQDLGVIARVPLASGFLGGAYRPGHQFSHGDVRAWRPQAGRDREIERALAALAQKPESLPAPTWAIGWCLQHPQVACVIPGSKSLAQLEENIAAGDLRWPA